MRTIAFEIPKAGLVRCRTRAWLGVALWLGAALAIHAGPVLRVVKHTDGGVPLLRNGSFEETSPGSASYWHGWGKGFQLAPGQGRHGSQAVVCVRSEGDGEFGASQTLPLNRTNIAPLTIRGWSRAENVTGSPDNGYSLYVDIIYADDTTLWGQAVSFGCGTHDWEQRQFVLLPDKPVKSLTLHCLFRGHTGKVWFDDVSLAELPTPAGAVMFQGVPVVAAPTLAAKPKLPERTFATKDNLKLTLRDNTISSLTIAGTELATPASSGFLARDFAANSDFFTFSNGVCAELKLKLKTQITSQSDALVVEGHVADTAEKDRAVTLLFALPVDASGWRWGDDIRHQRVIAGEGEFVNSVSVPCGADGRMSRYPLAAIWNDRVGLALALDMEHPAQYRLVYHAGTRQFFIAYDFGLTTETARFPSSADFRFVLFRFDPRWGFRAALQKFYDLFPAQFAKRVKREGVWMPFTDIARVPGSEDFGFAFQEGAPNVAFDDQHDIASFVYVEPMSYWLPLAPETPRTYASALATLTNDLAGARSPEQRAMAAATFTSGIHTADDQFSLYLVKAPWCDGGVFTLNPTPGLPVRKDYPTTKADVMQEAIAAAFEKNRPAAGSTNTGLDGVYLDSFEMSGSQLNYRRDHFPFSATPLVFDPNGRPAQLMIFNTWEFARGLAREMRARHKLMFANGVLWNFPFPAPLLDVLGSEVNWLHQGEYLPDTDVAMNFRRALCYQKPYCLLLNTDYEKFTAERVERYFQRCLFYGIWPGFFDAEASSKDPYWTSARQWYERDRPMFKKYIPLLRRVTSAGWQPITEFTCDNSQLWLERYGDPSSGKCYVTVFNDTAQSQEGTVVYDRAQPSLPRNVRITELISGEKPSRDGKGWRVKLAPQSVALLEFSR